MRGFCVWPSVLQAVVIVGPVIGEVTDTTARILFEVSASGPLTVALSPTGPGAAPSGALEFVEHFIADVPSVVFCKGLTPGTRWAARWLFCCCLIAVGVEWAVVLVAL